MLSTLSLAAHISVARSGARQHQVAKAALVGLLARVYPCVQLMILRPFPTPTSWAPSWHSSPRWLTGWTPMTHGLPTFRNITMTSTVNMTPHLPRLRATARARLMANTVAVVVVATSAGWRHDRCTTSRLRKINFPHYDGEDDPLTWLNKCESYFSWLAHPGWTEGMAHISPPRGSGSATVLCHGVWQRRGVLGPCWSFTQPNLYIASRQCHP